MDFFSWLPKPALWAMLAVAFPLAVFGVRYLSIALQSGELKLFGRTIAERTKSPALFWALYADGVFLGGLVVFVIISAVVELFLVRA